ncbi:C1 family peptidase [Marinobacter pelagius]|uniref:Peptidase C1A papain C-terminal domain-containing protein n=1 Tax=Marinobacter pelagius TaxID=379482 RepID=A0A1I4XFJ4_9GAMM|nr:C1 family peptidase [Marinobacter pelagius]SFN24677.1 protein of unknown function [Marinobacter pelagius]
MRRPLLSILLTCVYLTPFPASAQSYSLGEDYDKELYLSVPKVAPLSRGNFDELPTRVSLLDYAPPVGDQGSAGSCVGWASTYAVASIAWGLTVEQSQGRLESSGPFSPSFVFNRIKVSENCDGGSNIGRALKDLSSNGTLPLSRFSYTPSDCTRMPTSGEYADARQFAIEGFRRLSSEYSRRSLHLSVRRALAQRHPVVFGMVVGPSFQSYKTHDRVLRISEEEQALYDKLGLNGIYQHEGFGGHAMAVVGYDDDRGGGAFHIMNSWGNGWGERGFAWVSYGDFIRWVSSAYEVVPRIAKAPEPKKPDFAGRTVLKGFRQTDLPLSASERGYSLRTALHSGARLRAEVSVSSDSYVYVIGTDDSSGRHTVLFPQQGEVSPLVSAGDTILLPGPTEDFYSRLDQNAGTDYLIVLHSRKSLDIGQLAKAMDRSGSDNVYKRLQAVIGKRLVTSGNVGFDDSHYEAIMGNDGILANVVSINHLATPVGGSDQNGPLIVIVSPEVDNADAYADGDQTVRYVAGDEVVIKGIAQDESEITDLEVTNGFDIKFSSRGPFVARVDLTDIPLGSSKEIIVRSRDANNNESSQAITIQRVKP